MSPELLNRRDFFQGALLLALAASVCASGCGSDPVPGFTAEGAARALDRKNFERVYADPKLRDQFQRFLTNVFHLYPEHELHAFIAETVAKTPRDPDVYLRIAQELPALSPFLGAFRYALPALAKQKRVMRDQTVQLLGDTRSFSGYLELGSHGRYLSALREPLRIEGPIYTSAPKPPTHSLEDMIDRGQIGVWGEPLAWSDYQPLPVATLGRGSLGLVSVYIGFHHCPLPLREGFIASLHEVMAPGGKLILRDHDVTNEAMDHLVGLAHDVFNAGTKEPWAVNAAELRHFYPLSFIVAFLEQRGFKREPGELRQDGDPTLNTLLAFSRV